MSTADDVLRAAGEQALAAGHRLLDHDELARACEDRGIEYEPWFAALVELRAQGLVQLRDYDDQVALLQLTDAGLWAHLTRARPDLADVTERLLDVLDGAEPNVALPLGAALGESPLLVEGLLDHLARRRMVVYSRTGGDSFRIHRFGR